MKVSLVEQYQNQLYHSRRQQYLHHFFSSIRQKYQHLHASSHLLNHQKLNSFIANEKETNQSQQLKMMIQWMENCLQLQKNKYFQDQPIARVDDNFDFEMVLKKIRDNLFSCQEGTKYLKENILINPTQTQLHFCLYVLMLSEMINYEEEIHFLILIQSLNYLEQECHSLVFQVLLVHTKWINLFASMHKQPNFRTLISFILMEEDFSYFTSDTYQEQLQADVLSIILTNIKDQDLSYFVNYGLFDRLLQCDMVKQAKICLSREMDSEVKEVLVDKWNAYSSNYQI